MFSPNSKVLVYSRNKGRSFESRSHIYKLENVNEWPFHIPDKYLRRLSIHIRERIDNNHLERIMLRYRLSRNILPRHTHEKRAFNYTETVANVVEDILNIIISEGIPKPMPKIEAIGIFRESPRFLCKMLDKIFQTQLHSATLKKDC